MQKIFKCKNKVINYRVPILVNSANKLISIFLCYFNRFNKNNNKTVRVYFCPVFK